MSSEASVIAKIQYILQDTGTATWATAVIQAQMAQALPEFSNYSPNIAKGTITFASTVKSLDISGLTDLIELNGDYGLEYPVTKDPIRYRNYEQRGKTILPVLTFTPSAGATAFVHYCAPHTVSGTATNTLTAQEENLFAELVAAQLVDNYALSKINVVNVGSQRAWVDFKQDAREKLSLVYQKLNRLKVAKMAVKWPTVE